MRYIIIVFFCIISYHISAQTYDTLSWYCPIYEGEIKPPSRYTNNNPDFTWYPAKVTVFTQAEKDSLMQKNYLKTGGFGVLQVDTINNADTIIWTRTIDTIPYQEFRGITWELLSDRVENAKNYVFKRLALTDEETLQYIYLLAQGETKDTNQSLNNMWTEVNAYVQRRQILRDVIVSFNNATTYEKVNDIYNAVKNVKPDE